MTSLRQADVDAVRDAICADLSRPEQRKLRERLETVASVVRLPLPSDGKCNKTPMAKRWELADSYLKKTDPRYATKKECLRIEGTLWSQLAEFDGAPRLPRPAAGAAQRILARPVKPANARCLLTGDPLTFAELKKALKITTNQVGSAELPVEYRKDLRSGGKHRADNIGWVSTARDRVVLRKILGQNGVPNSLLAKIQVKAYTTDKVTMPPHFSNRDYRWATWTDSAQFSARTECEGVELELLAQLLEFDGAPKLSQGERASVENHLGRSLLATPRQCPITGALLKYADFVFAVTNPKAGKSAYHVGHLEPLTRGGSHVRDNVVWMSEQGNRMQGNDTFAEIVALILSAAKFHGS